MIKDAFLAPLYQVRLQDLGPEHAVRVGCFCGAGPWYLNTFWLYRRHPKHEFIRWIVKGFACPNCGVRDVLTWSIVEGAWTHEQEAP